MTTTTGLVAGRLDRVFSPRSIAVLGTTRVPGTVPYDIFHNLLRDNFQGTLYPVSPKEPSIAGVKAYKYVLDIPDPVDLAIIVFPSSVVKLALEQCGVKGIKHAVIISAGFREVGEAGVRREDELRAIAAKYGILFVGPNCLGVINTDPAVHMNASFARRMPAEGTIGFLSQSGALCTAVLDFAHAKHIGFSKFVSFGNKADVSEIDLMLALRDDPATKVILLYLEEMSEGRAFVEAARSIIHEAGKPILVLKSGRTRQGATAAASHTGSLASSDDIIDAVLRQAGVIRCATIEEMFNNAIALAYQPLPRGKRVAIITNAGGPGVLTTDAAIHENLELATFSEDTTAIFKRSLPVTANIKNPVDVIGDARADRYRVALGAALGDEQVDGALVILTPQSMTDIDTIANEVCDIAQDFTKPTYASFMGETDVATGISILQERHIPHYILPESMCRAFARASGFQQTLSMPWEAPANDQTLSAPSARSIFAKTQTQGRSYLSMRDAMALLEAFGLPTVSHAFARDVDEAVQRSEALGFPVALKLESQDVVHKFDVGAVRLNITDPASVRREYDAMMTSVRASVPDARIEGVLVQTMAQKGEEVILGVKRDPSFGPVIMFGLGGIFVEIFKDVSFRMAPLSVRDAETMISEIRSIGMLTGARGRPLRDVAALRECLLQLSNLAMTCPEILELDLNPLLVHTSGQGCSVVDARILIATT